jgi:hypothetical protein
MGTRSFIGVMHGDVCKIVYCHWDGYLEHNGKILFENYDSPKANHLVSLGNLSSLGPNIGEKHEFDCPYAYGTPADRAWREVKSTMCTFYGRDRGETDTEFKTYISFAALVDAFEEFGCDFCYIMKEDVWYMFNSGNTSLRPLADELAKLDAVA